METATHEINVETGVWATPLATARHDKGGENEQSTIAIGHVSLPQLGGDAVLIRIVDGEGVGAIAFLTRENIVPIVNAITQIAMQAGVIPIPVPQMPPILASELN